MLQPPTMKVSAESADQIENRTFEEISVTDSASLIQVQMGHATATVQLYRALGGGW